MVYTLQYFLPALPECFLLVMACVILLAGAFSKPDSLMSYYLAQLTLLIASVFCYCLKPLVAANASVYLFDHMFVLDGLAVFLKIAILISVFVTFVYSRSYNLEHKLPQNETYVLGILSTLGMLVLVSASNLLTIYLGVELMSLPIYTMVALQRNNPRCIEAALKYFIIGAMASGFLLYGMSILFGITHSIDCADILAAIFSESGTLSLVMVSLAMVFLAAGVAFKLGAVPFHMWAPDVYDGAPNSITLFLSAAPKLAVFALLIRLFVNSMAPLHAQWEQLFIVISVLSMAVGNLGAIIQTNIKRMLAYSSIAHMGYMLLGFCSSTPEGYSASLFYMFGYVVMTLGAFGLIVSLSRLGFEANYIDDLSGLNQRSPWLAFMMMLVMFSLAGIPPMIGFIAKLGVLEALISVHHTYLAVAAILFAVIGAFYYIRIVKVMYFESPKQVLPVLCTHDSYVIFSVNGLGVLFLGLFPGALFSVCHYLF